MIVRLIVLIIAIALTLFISLLVLFNHRVNKLTRISFFLLSLGLCLWQANIYVADTQTDNLITLNTILFLWPAIAGFSSAIFSLSLEDQKASISIYDRLKIHKAYTVSLTVLLFLQLYPIATSNIFTNVYVDEGGLFVFERHPYYFLFLAGLILTLILGLSKLIASYRSHSDSMQRSAIKAVLISILVTVFYSIITNVLVPIINSSQAAVSLGVFGIVFFSFGLGFSILRYRFLNIRPFVVRSVTYFLALGLLVMLYGFLTSIVNKTFDDGSLLGLFLSVAITISIVLAYEPTRKLFNKITSRIFFRDAYEPQVFLEELNKALVNNIEVELLISKSVEVIESNLNAEFVGFYLRETLNKKSRMLGDYHSKLTEHNEDLLRNIILKTKRKVISINNVADDDQEAEVVNLLKEADIDVIVQLVSASDTDSRGVGYIFIGSKKSGNTYNSQDTKILEIISDELAIAIQNALRFEEIEQFNVTLQKKIDDATRELKKSNEKLQALDEAKDEFISMASHQLRTPLTSVKGYISMVMEGDAGKVSSTQKQMLGQAMFSSQRMVYLISDLLNVSRLKTGKFVIEPAAISLPDVVDTELGQLTEGAAAKNITLAFDKPKKFPIVMLDELKIRQVVMNFVDNALYYTPTGGKIDVQLKNGKDYIEFTVKDNGIGVPKSEQHKLFTKFYRAGNARKARPDGTGLGLFMAKKVVIAQGGSIIFDSKEGKGSTFGFKFPKAKIET